MLSGEVGIFVIAVETAGDCVDRDREIFGSLDDRLGVRVKLERIEERTRRAKGLRGTAAWEWNAGDFDGIAGHGRSAFRLDYGLGFAIAFCTICRNALRVRLRPSTFDWRIIASTH
jgi:hypothetical protein